MTRHRTPLPSTNPFPPLSLRPPRPQQTTTVKLLGTPLISYSKDIEGASKEGDSRVNYGPFTKVDAFAAKPFRVHYEFPKPLVRVTRLVREIKVSPYGKVEVTET